VLIIAFIFACVRPLFALVLTLACLRPKSTACRMFDYKAQVRFKTWVWVWVWVRV